jgi:hypothetical protein
MAVRDHGCQEADARVRAIEEVLERLLGEIAPGSDDLTHVIGEGVLLLGGPARAVCDGLLVRGKRGGGNQSKGRGEFLPVAGIACEGSGDRCTEANQRLGGILRGIIYSLVKFKVRQSL